MEKDAGMEREQSKLALTAYAKAHTERKRSPRKTSVRIL